MCRGCEGDDEEGRNKKGKELEELMFNINSMSREGGQGAPIDHFLTGMFKHSCLMQVESSFFKAGIGEKKGGTAEVDAAAG